MNIKNNLSPKYTPEQRMFLLKLSYPNLEKHKLFFNPTYSQFNDINISTINTAKFVDQFNQVAQQLDLPVMFIDTNYSSPTQEWHITAAWPIYPNIENDLNRTIITKFSHKYKISIRWTIYLNCMLIIAQELFPELFEDFSSQNAEYGEAGKKIHYVIVREYGYFTAP